MAKQRDLVNYDEATNKADSPIEVEAKKPFIEPELSAAVDVLEATTFFQAVTSGATN